MPPEATNPIHDRLARLEVVVETLADDVQTFVKAKSGINWSAMSITLAALVGIFGYFNQRIDSVEHSGSKLAETESLHTEQRAADNRERILQLDARLAAQVEREQNRNNALERDMGESQMFLKLYMAGKVKD